MLTSSLDKTLALWGSEVRCLAAEGNYHFEPPLPLDAAARQILQGASMQPPDRCFTLPPPSRRVRTASGWSRRACRPLAAPSFPWPSTAASRTACPTRWAGEQGRHAGRRSEEQQC